MAHSIELLLDDTADGLVRHRWLTLAELGARPAVGRPHCTLIAGSRIAGVDALLGTVAQRLPLPLLLGPPIVLPAGDLFTLAASVVPSAELLSVHATVHRLCRDGVDGLADHSAPGAWTPHVTLARRLTADQVGAALAAVDCTPIPARAAAIRRWDGDTTSERVVAGRAC